MTPLTLVIDRRFTGVGRIKKASGTTKRPVFRKINDMLTDLYEQGRLDVLRAIRDGEISALEVYGALRAGRDITGQNWLKPLAETMRAWIASADEFSKEHRHSLTTSLHHIERARPTALVADLPDVVRTLRKTLGTAHPRSFNLCKAAAQTFLRAEYGRRSQLYLDVRDIDVKPVPKSRKSAPLAVAQMRGFFEAPESDWVDAIAWTMATTGMGQKEMWGEWHVLADRIHIEGTKRAGRVRDVPLVLPPSVPKYGRKAWEDAVRKRAKGQFSPYDLRRTYSIWLEAAGVPRTRRKLYMGHGARDVTDLYERHEVAAFLAEDANRLRVFLGFGPTKTPTIRLHARGKSR